MPNSQNEVSVLQERIRDLETKYSLAVSTVARQVVLKEKCRRLKDENRRLEDNMPNPNNEVSVLQARILKLDTDLKIASFTKDRLADSIDLFKEENRRMKNEIHRQSDMIDRQGDMINDLEL